MYAGQARDGLFYILDGQESCTEDISEQEKNLRAMMALAKDTTLANRKEEYASDNICEATFDDETERTSNRSEYLQSYLSKCDDEDEGY